jgi:twinkle protein
MFCFSCRSFFPGDEAYKKEHDMPFDNNNYQQPAVKGYISAITDRGITKETAEKYGVRIQQDSSGAVVKHYYPYYDVNNTLVANKVRDVANKTFTADPPGSMSAGVLFGQLLCQEGGKFVTICEGELDAMAAYQMLGSKYPAVSISIHQGWCGSGSQKL